MILDGVGVGTKTGEIHIEFQLRAEGRYTPAPKIYFPPTRSSWTRIPDGLRDTLRPTGAPTRLRVVLESETDLPMLESFFAEPSVLIRSPMRPETQHSNLQAAIEHRPARPQTNPHLDPRVYDPFPGIPVSLGRITHQLPKTKSVSKSSAPAEPSQELAAMELSDSGGTQGGHQNENDDKGADSDIVSVRSSSSAWSFLGKSRENNPAPSSPSSSSSSEPLPSLPSPPPPPPRRPPKRAPVVVKSEPESDSDVQIVKTIQKKPKQSNGTGKEAVKTKEKKKKKRRDVVELIAMEADDNNEEVEDVDEDDPEPERKKRKKKRREKRKSKNPDNDGDIEMESDARSIPPKKKKKKSKRKATISDSESPILTKKTKKKEKGKSKEIQPQSESDDPPPRKPSGSIAESRRPTKRKHPDSGSDGNDNDNEANSEDLSVQRERLKKRINEINLTKHELRVEQEELKAKLLRLDFTTRQLDGAGNIRAHCVCSACKKYGHRKNSVVCEMHPDAIRIALWRRGVK